MSKIYYNQGDSRWASHPYTAPGYEKATVKTSGCGPTCAAMIISSCKETIYPNEMCDISKQNGYRVSGGTSDGLFPYVAERWGLEYKRLTSSYEAYEYCEKGWFVVICCKSGLWTTGGHYILAVGTNSNREIQIYDPYLYSGKFNIGNRAGKVRLSGNSAWVQIDTFKANSNAQRFFAFNVGGTENTAPKSANTSNSTKTMYVNTKSDNLNVRKSAGGAVIGSLKKGTKVTVYEESKGWSRIGTNKWVSSSYLSTTKPGSSSSSTSSKKTMYVNTKGANLNVRKTANGTIVGTVAKGTAVIVTKTSNGWSYITSPKTGWVSSSYLSSSKPSAAKSTAKTMYVKTNSSNLNVRKTANGTVIGTIAKGTKVTVSKTSNGWSYITSPKTGWVSSKYLSSSK